MGQSASRNRPPQAPPHQDSPQAESSSSGSINSTPTSSTRAVSSAIKRSRYSSLRRSFLGLIPHSSSSGSLRSNSSSAAESTQPPKKRWRSSRRWSKAPASPQLEVAELGQGSPSIEGLAESRNVPNVNTSTGARPCTPLPVSGSPVVEVPTEVNVESVPDVGQHLSQSIGTRRSGTGTISPADGSADSARDTGELPHSVDEDVDAHDSHEDTDEPATGPAPEPDPQVQAAHQFPPPGTLVVVQGVVNTTDAPTDASAPPSASSLRHSRSTTPRPASTGNLSTPHRRSVSISATGEGERRGTRSRLSSFITRSRPSSDIRPAAESASNRNSATSSDISSSISHDTVSAEDSSSTENQEAERAEVDGRPRPLSPGSIDVLGTLLSVAAAATAASLFSPGLAFQSANGVSNIPGNRPMSPTPTAGLGNLSGLAGLGLDPLGSNPGQGHTTAQGQRDGRDRIRNVWESVRERLGLNGRNPAFSGLNPSQAEGTNGSGESRMRPGEMMLAEMARALNSGLGLNSDGGQPASRPADEVDIPASEVTENTAQSASEDHPLPPEDSFERFLINLQADLRTALSEDGAAARSERNSVPLPTSSASTNEEEPEAGPSTSTRPVQTSSTDMDTVDTADSSNEQNDAVHEDEPPSLADLSDSDSEDDEDEEDDMHDGSSTDHDDPYAPRSPTPIPTGVFPFGGDHRHGPNGDRRLPGVNLWRLYRFQPIPASQTQGHAASTSSGTPASANTDAVLASTPEGAGSASTTSSSPSSAEAPPTHPNPDSAPSSEAADPNANVVVPVIVVGLQSVDMARNRNHIRNRPDVVQPTEDARVTDSSIGLSEDYRQTSGTPSDAPGATSSRGRTWQSRAANALRTFRPGRRGGSRNGQTSDATGARTFLIYVIGGYYPPNHHMVTGSDSLDSYEALWELAELLGQVKPPVATREDIDKSGLQIIKASDLTQHEKEGRVASNCVERCLICLDDYDVDDEMRLMSCKHAFHKECVDKWLQVGRNNCPACRSQGVSTVGDASS